MYQFYFDKTLYAKNRNSMYFSSDVALENGTFFAHEAHFSSNSTAKIVNMQVGTHIPSVGEAGVVG